MTTAEKLKQEGRQEGLLEGEQRVLLRQLARRFALGAEALERVRRERLAGATLEQLDSWSERILEASTWEQVFAD